MRLKQHRLGIDLLLYVLPTIFLKYTDLDLMACKTSACMKIIAFLDVSLFSLVEVYRRFRGACYLHHCPDGRGARISETSAYYNETTRLYMSEGYHVHSLRRQNIKSLERAFRSLLWPLKLFNFDKCRFYKKVYHSHSFNNACNIYFLQKHMSVTRVFHVRSHNFSSILIVI
jgi:hypothetical protein